MKLYTEEQVRDAIRFYSINNCGYHKLWFEDKVVEKLTPIELPSDEEIETIAMGLYGFKATSIKDVLEYKAFKRGARLVLNKIQGGINETI